MKLCETRAKTLVPRFFFVFLEIVDERHPTFVGRKDANDYRKVYTKDVILEAAEGSASSTWQLGEAKEEQVLYAFICCSLVSFARSKLLSERHMFLTKICRCLQWVIYT